MEAVPFLQRELSKIGIAINPSKTAALPPKGHVPTPDQNALVEGIGDSIAECGGVMVVGVPVGTDEYARESAMEIVRNGEAEQLARMLSRTPDKQSANLITTGLWCSGFPTLNARWTQSYRCLRAKKQISTPCRCWGSCSTSRGQHIYLRFSRTGARQTCRPCNPINKRRRFGPRGPEGLGCRRLKPGGCQHPLGAWWRR